MSSRITGTKERISVPIPGIITNPLTSFLSLQTLFGTEALNQGYQSHCYLLKEDHHLLCITTNNKGLFILSVRSGNIIFYEKERVAKAIDLSSKDITTVLINFYNAIKESLYCEICSTDYNRAGERREFRYRLSSDKNNLIVREHLQVECYS